MGHRVEDQRLSIFLHDNDTLLQSNIYHNIDVQLDTYGKNMLIIYTSLCNNNNRICYIYIYIIILYTYILSKKKFVISTTIS